MEKAVDAARQGSLAFFESLDQNELMRLSTRKDEDGRYLLHTAAVGGNLELVQLIVNAGGKDAKEFVNSQDDEVGVGQPMRGLLIIRLPADCLVSAKVFQLTHIPWKYHSFLVSKFSCPPNLLCGRGGLRS